MIKRQIEHIKKWNEWRKYSLNSPISKFLVLFGIIKSPTFESYFTEKERKDFVEKFMQELKEGEMQYSRDYETEKANHEAMIQKAREGSR